MVDILCEEVEVKGIYYLETVPYGNLGFIEKQIWI
jgi:hypothetical protein